jgi:hypothetical protein
METKLVAALSAMRQRFEMNSASLDRGGGGVSRAPGRSRGLDSRLGRSQLGQHRADEVPFRRHKRHGADGGHAKKCQCALRQRVQA